MVDFSEFFEAIEVEEEEFSPSLEKVRIRLSLFFFGVDNYDWPTIVGQYKALLAQLEDRYDWVRGPASDTLAYLDLEDEELLKSLL